MKRLTFDFKRGFQIESHAIDKVKLWNTGADIGEPVHAGVSVSQESALRLSVVWACIRLIASTLGALPADIVRKVGEIREPVDRVPSWVTQANPDSSWFEFAERCFESLEMDGNAFILISGRDANGFPAELWTLNPRQVDVRRGPDGKVFFLWAGDQRLSRYGPANPLGDVLHIKGLTAGGIRGMSPIEAARQAIGLGLVTEKTGARFFGQGMMTDWGIELPDGPPPRSKDHIDIMRETLKQNHGGSSGSFNPLIATGGAKFVKFTITPEEAQFLQTRAFQVEDIASRIYGVPPHMVGLTEKQTSWGTGLEQQVIGFVRFSLLHRIVRFETAMSSLLPRGQFLRLNQRGLLRADSATETEVLTKQLQNGVINFDTWRALLDLPPRPGGDRYILPLNMQILAGNGQAVPAPTPEVSPNGNGQAPAEVTQP